MSSRADLASRGLDDEGSTVSLTIANGGRIKVCPPCAKVRGYAQEDLLEGVEIVGSVAVHELIKEGAATLSF